MGAVLSSAVMLPLCLSGLPYSLLLSWPCRILALTRLYSHSQLLQTHYRDMLAWSVALVVTGLFVTLAAIFLGIGGLCCLCTDCCNCDD